MNKPAEAKRAGSPTGALPEVRTGRATRARRADKKATIYDLARMAGVSPGTVSRVLNNRDRVKAETRKRVLRAATTLNLKPQASVRLRTVAILSEPSYPDRVEGYAATLTAHLSFAFARRNIGVLLPSDPFEELPNRFLDGIVVVTEDKALKGLVANLEKRIPAVHIDKFPAEPDEYVVCSDHYNAGYLAARHFVERGKRRPAFFGGNYVAFAERLRGFKQALAEADLAADEICTSLYSPEINHMSVLTRLVRVHADAIYAPGSSFQALECLHILGYVMGLRIPEDVALIGGENEGISSLLNPPLTTIEEPLREMAAQVAAMVDQLTSGQALAERHIMLPVRLIERNSVR
jgi:LacI family transcriptional regulator